MTNLAVNLPTEPPVSFNQSVLPGWGAERDILFMEKLLADIRCSGYLEQALDKPSKKTEHAMKLYKETLRMKNETILTHIRCLKDSTEMMAGSDFWEFLKSQKDFLMSAVGSDNPELAKRIEREIVVHFSMFYQGEA